MKNEKSKQLYEFILKEAPVMTEEWLKTRTEEGSLYSKHASEETEMKLKEQNTAFIQTIAATLVTLSDKVENHLKKWSVDIARDRAVHEVPLYEIIGQFKIFRHIFCSRIETFTQETELEVTLQDVCQWNQHFHATFDDMIERLSEEYDRVTISQLNAQREMIQELSAPVIPVSKEIGILPLIGEIDTYRAKIILESVLEQASRLRLTHLFIDISGVPVVDTMVAYQLFKVVDSAKLLGIETIISGIRPEIAQTVVKLGIDFSKVNTEHSLAKALEKRGFRIFEEQQQEATS
ncbi:RsbT co-antagonist protein RsbRD [Bacillus safensis]|uniref:STAS domain-containing protein n=1 Tax=Bacillus safensis TaxID=561879 RepID=UPI000651032C|nr:STAS domain-containing protein [Bacillus safensis]KML13178.1 RsbT co-antagonist protein RsbRD [Bacillus safensis]KML50046.1 RsbT co-antagonist protein RsbRD [Bacillus safensis]KMN78520.1 RsbT co-antagonist protein RsbRD [Bacillus safensis]USD81418.1 STAS domain-containing protein [Bacillus safensis]